MTGHGIRPTRFCAMTVKKEDLNFVLGLLAFLIAIGLGMMLAVAFTAFIVGYWLGLVSRGTAVPSAGASPSTPRRASRRSVRVPRGR